MIVINYDTVTRLLSIAVRFAYVRALWNKRLANSISDCILKRNWICDVRKLTMLLISIESRRITERNGGHVAGVFFVSLQPFRDVAFTIRESSFCDFSDCVYWNVEPPLWCSGQSSWLHIQRSGFDSRRYQIFWEVLGLERGPLSLVSTVEELTEWYV
jgi:hypothetical protein